MKSSEAPYRLELTTPSDREIVMVRTFHARRADVFDAFTQPELIRRWLLGPDGWSMPVCIVDLTVGGTYKYTWRNDEDGAEFGVSGTFLEIEKPDRTKHVELFDGAEHLGGATVTNVFAEHDGTTTVTMTILHESREARDMALASGMEHGVARSYDRLASILDSNQE